MVQIPIDGPKTFLNAITWNPNGYDDNVILIEQRDKAMFNAGVKAGLLKAVAILELKENIEDVHPSLTNAIRMEADKL